MYRIVVDIGFLGFFLYFVNVLYGIEMTKFNSLALGLRGGCDIIWWRHQTETFSALLVLCVGTSPVTGEIPSERPVTRSFDVFFDLRLNKRLSKQSWGWWFETPSPSLSRHCTEITAIETHTGDRNLEIFLRNRLDANATRTKWWVVSIGSVNGLLPSGSKPLPEPTMTEIHVALWLH